MAKDPATVARFLGTLAADLRPLRDADLASLRALKAAEEGGDPATTVITMVRRCLCCFCCVPGARTQWRAPTAAARSCHWPRPTA